VRADNQSLPNIDGLRLHLTKASGGGMLTVHHTPGEIEPPRGDKRRRWGVCCRVAQEL
jgi:hypothetical protein